MCEYRRDYFYLHRAVYTTRAIAMRLTPQERYAAVLLARERLRRRRERAALVLQCATRRMFAYRVAAWFRGSALRIVRFFKAHFMAARKGRCALRIQLWLRAETARYVVNIRRLRRLHDGALRKKSLPKEQKFVAGSMVSLVRTAAAEKADDMKAIAYDAQYKNTMRQIKKHGF